MTNQGKVRWMVFEAAMNAGKLIGFFKRLVKDAPSKVFLILGNLPVHHSRMAETWLREHAELIEVFYLPPYSPELNPDECLNADLKAAMTTKAPLRTKRQLKTATISHLRTLQRSPSPVRKCFEHRPVRYAVFVKYFVAGSMIVTARADDSISILQCDRRILDSSRAYGRLRGNSPCRVESRPSRSWSEPR